MRSSCSWLLAATCLSLIGCHGDGVFESNTRPRILASQITADELPDQLEASRTFYSNSYQVHDPENLLRQMWSQGLRPVRAWQHVDAHQRVCLALATLALPGPRFTVELAVDDPRILDYGFNRGIQGLTCSSRYTRYVILDP